MPRTLGTVLAVASPSPSPPRHLTFGELVDAAQGIVGGLSRVGVHAGDRVAVALPADQ